MSNRHSLRAGDWVSVARRLEELVSTGTGEDPYEVLLELVLAKLVDERFHGGSTFPVLEAPGITRRSLDSLMMEARARWPGIIDRPTVTRLRDQHLEVCARELGPLSLTTASASILDALFETIVRPSTKAERGQFFTPRHVVEACVRMVDPQPGELVLDPACGSGGFLLHAWRHVVRAGQDPSAAAESLAGFDNDPKVVRLARVLLLTSTGHDALVSHADTLLPSSAVPMAQVILANPPFAGEVRDASVLEGYHNGRGRTHMERDVLFLERCTQLLRPGGRMAIVLPHNKLGGRRWASLRSWLLRELRVHAVVGLPRDTFQPHTGQKTCILLASRRPRPVTTVPTEEILFLIAEKGGKDRRGRPEFRPGAAPEGDPWDAYDHDLDEVVRHWHSHVGSEVLHGST